MDSNIKKSYKTSWVGDLGCKDVIVDFNCEKYSANYSVSHLGEIDTYWFEMLNQAKLNNKNLYNSSLFRLDSLAIINDKLKLNIGETNYRQYVATRNLDCPIKFSNPIGTSLLLVTSDDYLVLTRRPPSADVNPNKIFSFGGFFDADVDLFDGKPDIFSCIRRELYEEFELLIPRHKFRLIAIVQDLEHVHYEASFLTTVNLTGDEVMRMKLSSEIESLNIVPLSNISEYINDNIDTITPTLYAALISSSLYK